jgi:hypothetical protein
MATSGQGIWFSLGTGSVRDYSHAAQIFRTNDFARAPKSKYLFYVTFNINPAATSDQFISAPNPVGPNELSYLVKSIDMPKFEIDVQDLNQYNKKTIIQRNIKYNPINIKFHDDNIGSLRNFWQSYYHYYFADGSYNNLDYDPANTDTYTTRNKSRWGMDTGAKTSYLTSIEIYSMYHGTEAQLITLQNPFISNFSHDTHDYAEGTGMLESSMQVHYSGVTYEDMIDASYGIPGFGLNSPDTYDTETSDIAGPNGLLKVNVSTGQLFDPQNTNRTSTSKIYKPNQSLAAQTNSYNQTISTATNIISNNQLDSVLQNTYSMPSTNGYIFPTMNTKPYQNQDYGAVPITEKVVFSDGTAVPSPNDLGQLYSKNSWQAALYEKGYNNDQISAADQYITSAGIGAFGAGLPPLPGENYTPPNYQQIAEQFLNNPPSSYNYGQKPVEPYNQILLNSTSSTQPVYQGIDWSTQLSQKGYSAADISNATQFLSTLRLAPGTDITEIATSYINNNKSQRSSTNNIPAEDGIVYTGGTPNFDETTGTYISAAL